MKMCVCDYVLVFHSGADGRVLDLTLESHSNSAITAGSQHCQDKSITCRWGRGGVQVCHLLTLQHIIKDIFTFVKPPTKVGIPLFCFILIFLHFNGITTFLSGLFQYINFIHVFLLIVF